MAKKTIRGYYQNTSSGESVFVKSATGSKTMEVDSRGRSSSGYQVVNVTSKGDIMAEGVVYDSAGNPKSYSSNRDQILIGSKSDTAQAQSAAGISIKTSYSSSPVSQGSIRESYGLGVYDNVKLQTRLATPFEEMYVSDFERNNKMSYADQGSSRSAQSYLNDPNVKYVYFRGDQAVSVVSEVKPVSSGFTPDGMVSEYKGSNKIFGGLSSVKSAFVEGYTMNPSVDYRTSQASGVSSLAFTSGVVANLATIPAAEFLGSKAGFSLFKNTKYFNYAQKGFSVLKNPVVNSALMTGFVFYGASKIDQAAQAYKAEGSVGVARVAWMTNVEVSSLTAFSKGVSSGISSAQGRTHFFTQGSSNVGSLMAAESQTEGGFLSVSKSRGKVFEFYEGDLRRSLNYRDLSTAEGRYNVLSSKKYVKNGFDVSENVVSLRGKVDSKTNIFYMQESTKMTDPIGYVKYLSKEGKIDVFSFSPKSYSFKFNVPLEKSKNVLGVYSHPKFKAYLRGYTQESIGFRDEFFTNLKDGKLINPEVRNKVNPKYRSQLQIVARHELEHYFQYNRGIIDLTLPNTKYNSFIDFPERLAYRTEKLGSAKTFKIPSKERVSVSTSYDYGDVMAIQTNREVFAGEIGGSKIGSGLSKFGLEEQRLSFRNSLGESKISNNKLFSEGKSKYSYESKVSESGLDMTTLKGSFKSVEVNQGKVSGRIKFKETITQLKPVSNFENAYQGGSVNVQIQETLTKKLTDSLGGSLKSMQLRESQVSSVKPFGSSFKSRQVSESVFSSGKSDFRVEALSVSVSSSALKTDQLEKSQVSVSSFRSPSLLTEQKSSSRSRNIGSQSLRQLSSFDLNLAQDQTQVQSYALALRQNQAQRQRVDLNLRQQQIYQSAQGSRSQLFGFSEVMPPSKNLMFNLPKLPKGRESKGSGFLMGFSSFNPQYTSSLEADLLGIKGKKPSKYDIETGISLRPILRGF